MSEKVLRIFDICKELASLLGDKQAVADLQILLERHPEMFANLKDLINTIETVAKEPEIIVDATHSNKDIGILKAAKRLDSKKMGDIVVKNNNGVNEIFHANKKNIKEFHRLHKQVVVGSRDAHFLHPDLDNQLGLVQKAHLPTTNMDSLVETPAPSTHRQKPTGELTTHKNDELSGANARSANPRVNSTTELTQTQSKPKLRRNK